MQPLLLAALLVGIGGGCATTTRQSPPREAPKSDASVGNKPSLPAVELKSIPEVESQDNPAVAVKSNPQETTTDNKDELLTPEQPLTFKPKAGAFKSPSSLTPRAVAQRVHSTYLSGIKSCHHQALGTNPLLGGLVTLHFTVGPTGQVTKADAKGFDAAIDECIEKKALKNWTFEKPTADSKPTSADFGVPLLLKPAT